MKTLEQIDIQLNYIYSLFHQVTAVNGVVVGPKPVDAEDLKRAQQALRSTADDLTEIIKAMEEPKGVND